MSERPVQRDYYPAARNGHALPIDWQGVPDDVSPAWSWRTRKSYAAIVRRNTAPGAKDRLVQRLGLVLWSWPGCSSGWS